MLEDLMSKTPGDRMLIHQCCPRCDYGLMQRAGQQSLVVARTRVGQRHPVILPMPVCDSRLRRIPGATQRARACAAMRARACAAMRAQYPGVYRAQVDPPCAPRAHPPPTMVRLAVCVAQVAGPPPAASADSWGLRDARCQRAAATRSQRLARTEVAEGGDSNPGTRKGPAVFKTAAISRSAIPPRDRPATPMSRGPKGLRPARRA